MIKDYVPKIMSRLSVVNVTLIIVFTIMIALAAVMLVAPASAHSLSGGIWSNNGGIWSNNGGIWSNNGGIGTDTENVWSNNGGIWSDNKGIWSDNKGIDNLADGSYTAVGALSWNGYVYLPTLQDPVGPTFEGQTYFDFTLDPASYNATTHLFEGTPIQSSVVFENLKDGVYVTIPLEITQINYYDSSQGSVYDANGDGLADLLIKGKFVVRPENSMSWGLDNNDLDQSNPYNSLVTDFYLKTGEFNITCINASPAYTTSGYQNYEALGKFYFYGYREDFQATNLTADTVLVMEFSNDLSVAVPNLGEPCHLTSPTTFHVEGDTQCYPGVAELGFKKPKVWLTSETVLLDLLYRVFDLTFESDDPDFVSYTKRVMVSDENMGQPYITPCMLADRVFTGDSVSLDTQPLTGPIMIWPGGKYYFGNMTAYPIDGYSGAIGYAHYSLVIFGSGEPRGYTFTVTPVDGMDRTYRIVYGMGAMDEGVNANYFVITITDGTYHSYPVPGGRIGGVPSMNDGYYEVTEDHTFALPGEYVVQAGVSGMGQDTMYILVPGVRSPAVGKEQNYVKAAGVFFDQALTADSIYTATINWGDGSKPDNAQVWSKTNKFGGVSGFAAWGHVYNAVGMYTGALTVYKNGDVFGISEFPVNITSVRIVPKGTTFEGWIGNVGSADVTYQITWGDGQMTTGDYENEPLSLGHNYAEAGLFDVTIEFLSGGQPFTQRSAQIVGTVTRGMDISVNGARVITAGAATVPHDFSASDAITASVEIPTNLGKDVALTAEWNWGDTTTYSTVNPDAYGKVYLVQSHTYGRAGQFSPSVRLVLANTMTIGQGNSPVLNLKYRLGAIVPSATTVPDQGPVTLSTVLPFDTATWPYGGDWRAIWHWGDGTQSDGVISGNTVTGTHVYAGIATVPPNPAANKVCTVELELVRGSNVDIKIASAIFDHITVLPPQGGA